ncbi:hypothetical protein GN244_ATG15623 [Phytophthora infestans]|uniref:Uncharacterized protein n=1 Tax=Phytophthora infestans TaxID=4787 RepID=A0A833SV02_PHYIN|nr:hypothetical protein GN244_ATG15621 [Phytophthora infestans]KAF4032461.1 hypothetical protein GN244_ATG15623 [Phytophthora infestans]
MTLSSTDDQASETTMAALSLAGHKDGDDEAAVATSEVTDAHGEVEQRVADTRWRWRRCNNAKYDVA